MATMKAVRINDYGSSEMMAYEDAARPEPAADALLVRVRAASVNPVDWKMREGYLQAWVDPPRPLTLGRDLSGDVVEVGPAVTDFQVGDAVFGTVSLDKGTHAEYVVVRTSEVARKPDSVDYDTAAAIPLAALAAWQCLMDAGGLQPGHRVLVHGAGGAVGNFAVQFAHQHGAHVLAVTSKENSDLLRSLGADEVIDYEATPFEDGCARRRRRARYRGRRDTGSLLAGLEAGRRAGHAGLPVAAGDGNCGRAGGPRRDGGRAAERRSPPAVRRNDQRWQGAARRKPCAAPDRGAPGLRSGPGRTHARQSRLADGRRGGLNRAAGRRPSPGAPQPRSDGRPAARWGERRGPPRRRSWGGGPLLLWRRLRPSCCRRRPALSPSAPLNRHSPVASARSTAPPSLLADWRDAVLGAPRPAPWRV